MTAEPASATAPAPRDAAVSRRRVARLAAVQALYQVEMTGSPAGQVVDEWRLLRLGPANVGEGMLGEADIRLFADVVEGVARRQSDLDGMIAPALAAGWTLARLEVVLRAVLRAGVYELIARSDVPARVAINEYVDIARGFFAGREPAFVNAVLDSLARRLRPDEFEAGGGAPTAG